MKAGKLTNHMMCALFVLGLSACGDEDGAGGVAPGNTLVFEGSGSVQCGPPGMTPQQSAQTLINGGIDVVESGCGAMTGVAFPTLCGVADGDILLHELRAANLRDAEQLGFSSVSVLRNSEGRGYAWVDCQTGAIIR